MSIRYTKGAYALRKYPIADATAVAQGDLISVESNLATVMASANDNLTFRGVAYETKVANDGKTEISVYMPLPETEFEVDLDAAATVEADAPLAFNAAQKLTPSGTDAIAFCNEKVVSKTKCFARFKLPAFMVGDAS